MKRVVIIGAGPGGLAAAMLLARAGLAVHVLERLPHVGGRTSTLHGGGFRFDLGPTFFLYPASSRRSSPPSAATCTTRCRWSGSTRSTAWSSAPAASCWRTPDVARMERAIAALSPRDAASFRRFLADNRGQDGRGSARAWNRRSCGWRDLLSPQLLQDCCRCCAPGSRSTASWRRYFRDPRVRLAFTFQSKYLGMSPFNCPSLFSILSFLEYEYGVFHPIGGCGAVTEAMARVAADLGVEISLDERGDARSSSTAGGPSGVRTDRRRPPADAAGHQRRLRPRHDPARPRPPPPPLDRRARSPGRSSPARPSCCTSASRGATTTWPHHTIYTGRGLRAEPRRDREPRTSCRTTRRSTCRTPASPTRRSPRRA